jgi:hypothetical protein
MNTKLKSILEKENLDHLLPGFIEQGVTDSILGDLSADDLRDLGMDKLGERKRLLAAFANETPSPSFNSVSGAQPTFTPQEQFTYEASHGAIKITGFQGKGHVVIPQIIDDLPVRSIAAGVFTNNGSLISVVIPECVTIIENNAFWGCSSLTSITIPSTLTSNLELAILDCPKLENINVSGSNSRYSFLEGVLYDLGRTTIFRCFSATKEFNIPDCVRTIGDNAFCNCTSLTNVTIPNGVTSIGDRAFHGCTGLTNVTIPNSVTSIGDWAFHKCTSLTNVTIPNSVTSIGDWAFHGCTGLTNVTIPNSVTSISKAAFCECTSLANITLPNRLTSVGNSAFAGTDFVSFTIPYGITNIPWGFLNGCKRLESVTIPETVTNIESLAFANSGRLKNITIPSGAAVAHDSFSGCPGDPTRKAEPEKSTGILSFMKWFS